jgi:hypothetical protein
MLENLPYLLGIEPHMIISNEFENKDGFGQQNNQGFLDVLGLKKAPMLDISQSGLLM